MGESLHNFQITAWSFYNSVRYKKKVYLEGYNTLSSNADFAETIQYPVQFLTIGTYQKNDDKTQFHDIKYKFRKSTSLKTSDIIMSEKEITHSKHWMKIFAYRACVLMKSACRSPI